MSKREMYLDQLEEERAQLLARASQAEQALATVTAERDEARAERDREVNAHDKLDTLAVAYARERDEARATASNYLEGWNAEVERLRGTLDTVIAREGSLKAKLAEAERERDEARAERDAKQAGYEALGEMLSATCEAAHAYAQEYECGHAGEDVVAVVVRDARDLRSRIAKVEAVVEAAREEHRILARDRARTGWGSNDMIYAMCQTSVALRALDADTGGEDKKGGSHAPSPVTPGTDSGGSGRTPGSATREAAHASSSGPEPGPEPAGSFPLRRDRLDLFTPAERAIWDATQAVERAGCDVRLTAAVNALQEARSLVADFVDGVKREPAPYGHISKADECQIDSPVGVAATAEDGHEAPAQNRQPVEPPSDPATGTTRREPPETDRQDVSTGAVATPWRRCPEVYPGSGMQCLKEAGHAGLHTDEPRHLDPQAPATRAELEELRREVLETVAEACDESEKRAYAPFPWPLTRLADVLRARIERGPRRVG